MDAENNAQTKTDKIKTILNEYRIFIYSWFFYNFTKNQRKEIFEIIYNSLFKDSDNNADDSSDEFIYNRDEKYNKKRNRDIIGSFEQKEIELNNSLDKYKIKLVVKHKYYLYLECFVKRFSIEIRCLRYVRFGNEYEWICNSFYLLYFQYCVMKYEKPSIIENIEEKEDIIDNYSKSSRLLEVGNFIYIIDLNDINIDYNKIFEDSNKEFIFSRENVLKYLDYNDNDPKQIEDNDICCYNNYKDIINFCFESHLDNLIYSFHNGNYFFEFNLINCLNLYRNKSRFFYMNLSKIEQIYYINYQFKKYLAFWITFLFQENVQEGSKNNRNKNTDNKSKYIEFINNLTNLVFKNKYDYLEIILDKLNKEFPRNMKYKNKALVILNNN